MVNLIFALVAGALYLMASAFGTTYNAINIIVYYFIIPVTWTLMADYLIGKPVLSALLAVIWIAIIIATLGHFQTWCDTAFRLSQDFLLWFKRIGWNYYVSSVIICVILPLAIYGVLGWFCVQKASWPVVRLCAIGIGAFCVIMLIGVWITAKFGTRLESTSQYNPNIIIPHELSSKIHSETKGMNVDEIIDYAERKTCEQLSFTFHGDGIHSGNCVDYANMCAAICNQAFGANGIDAHALRSKGIIKMFGIDLCSYISSRMRKGGSPLAGFFADHDFVTISTPQYSIVTDPSCQTA